MRIAWDDVRDEFRFDGALIDLYASVVGPEQWDRMFRALEGAGYRLSLSESEATGVVDFSQMQHLHERTGSASVDLARADRILLRAFLFDPDRIEITIDPGKVPDAEAYARLCGVVELIGAAVGRTITLCPENGDWFAVPVLLAIGRRLDAVATRLFSDTDLGGRGTRGAAAGRMAARSASSSPKAENPVPVPLVRRRENWILRFRGE